MNLSNQEIAKLLRSVGAALTLTKANQFQVRAYENAASSIEHLDVELKDLWEEQKLDDVPGIGKGLQEHLNELFKTGSVKHFEQLMGKFKPGVFEFLDIPGIGPKTALELSELGVENKADLKKKIASGELVKKGFSEKIAEKLVSAVAEESANTGRMLLPFASTQAEKILLFLKKGPGVVAADPLGSLRRRVATIGDLDFAAAATDPKKVIEYFIKMPGISRVVDQGENKAVVILHSGLHVDLLVGRPETYGALLQHFTGSKNHNIHLRTLAEKKGLSLSEHGIKKVKLAKIVETKTEADFYKFLGMQMPEPEMREDEGEIELAISHKLPKLIEFKDIKGDMHLHSNFPFQSPSHGPGVNPLADIVKKAISLGYKFVGLSDHPPGFRSISKDVLIKEIADRTKEIEKLRKSNENIRILNGLEVDILPDGTISVPDESLKTLDYAIAGVHSSHRMGKDEMTKRILTALENPYVDIISHPTGRILNDRNSFEADWEQIFRLAAKKKKLLEINAFPNRLDLRDDLIRVAKAMGCKFVINTDAHEISQMENMEYGVFLARRGWSEAKDIVNTWDWADFANWFDLDH